MRANKAQIKLFWMIAKRFDQVPKDSNYIDERLDHRVHNLKRGFNMDCEMERLNDENRR